MDINLIEFQFFLKLSEKLTAFTSFQLQGTGVAEAYYSTVKNVVGVTIFQELIDTFNKIQTDSDDETSLDKEIRHRILSNSKLGPVARNIIKMWFVGTWYQLPNYWLEKYGVSNSDSTFVVSENAYKEGLLWPTIGAHPMGAKAPGYGTWEDPPKIPTV